MSDDNTPDTSRNDDSQDITQTRDMTAVKKDADPADTPKQGYGTDSPQQSASDRLTSFQPPVRLSSAGPQPAKDKPFQKGFGLGAGIGLGLAGTLMILGLISTIVMALVIGGIVSSLGPASTSTATTRVETFWGSNSAGPADTIRAISISGPINADSSSGLGMSASTSGYEVASLIDSLKTEDSRAVLLMINTPGGTINGSKAIGDAVLRYRKRTGQKVFSYIRGTAASGGVYAMAGSDEIIADHGTLIGSIGVVFGPFPRYRDVVATGGTLFESGVTTTGGITQEYLTQGKGKDFGNPYRDMTPEERTTILNGLTNEYNNFVDWVSQNRDIPADVIRNDLGAYLYDASTARNKKLVDQVMGPDEAYRYIATQAGIAPEAMRIVVPIAPTSFERLLGAEDRVFGQIQAVAGDQTKVTSSLCTGTAQPLVLHGSLADHCGR